MVTQYAPARCTPDAAAQLQPIPYACDAQRALLPIAVGARNINELMNINDVRESATIFPRPCKLTFDLLTLKVVFESHVTWATCLPILVFVSLSVLELFPMYATDRQTDVRQHHRLMPPPRGHNNFTEIRLHIHTTHKHMSMCNRYHHFLPCRTKYKLVLFPLIQV